MQKSVSLQVKSIDETSRPVVKGPEKTAVTAQNGEPKFARKAVVLKKDGAPVTVDVIGTAAQWAYFDGVSIEATFAESKSTPGNWAWYFSPVSSGRVTDPDAF